jgi:hypothetical protein
LLALPARPVLQGVVQRRQQGRPVAQGSPWPPALMRLSTTRLVTTRLSVRAQKSYRDRKGPPCSRARTICSVAEVPTFLMVPSPNRMVRSSTTVNSDPDSFTSGGRTEIPMRRHSSTSNATRSRLPLSAHSTAVMYSAG